MAKRQNKVNRTDFIEQLAQNLGISKNQAEEVLGTTLDMIVEAVANGQQVNLTGFGSFYPVQRDSRKGINPTTKQQMTIPASATAGFRTGKRFKDIVQESLLGS